jgi:2'-5' RNA ligase
MSSPATNECVIYGLIPAAPARDHFQSLIDDLASRFDAQPFEPHVTLYGSKAAGENPEDVLKKAAANLKPLRLSVAGIDFSAKFTKTLFVQFRPDAAIAELSDRLRAASLSQREYELNPHLSLIYQEWPVEAKIELRNSIHLPFDEVEFDCVKAVLSPAKVESSEDVKRWQTVATKSLDQ